MKSNLSFSPGRSSLWAVHLANDQGIGNKESRDLQHNHGPLNSKKRQPHQRPCWQKCLRGHLLPSAPSSSVGRKVATGKKEQPASQPLDWWQRSSPLYFCPLKHTFPPIIQLRAQDTQFPPSRLCLGDAIRMGVCVCLDEGWAGSQTLHCR